MDLSSMEPSDHAHTCDTMLPSNETLQATVYSTLDLRIMSSMSQGRTSSAKEKASNVFYRKIKPPIKSALTTSNVCADCKCVNCCKSDAHHRMKRLRTRKERNQIRDSGRETSRAKSCEHFNSHHISKDVSHVHHQCCHNTSTTCAFPNIVPKTHEPSVITDSRLLGHHGLFNHEVKSIDIERVLSEQRKLNRRENLPENSSSTFSNSAFALDPPSAERHNLFDSSEEGGRFKKQDLNNIETFNHPQVQDHKIIESNSQCSDLTPGQRPRSFSNEAAPHGKSTKLSSSDDGGGVMVIKLGQPAVLENNSESHQTPSSYNENRTHLIPGSEASFTEHTPKNPASATNQTQASPPSPQLPSSPPMAEASHNLNAPEDSLVPDSVVMLVRATAARLCRNVSFSLLRKRNLVAESRNTLLKALRQRHGPHLQRNILKIQQLSYLCDSEEEGEVSKPCFVPEFAEKEGPFSTEDFMAEFKATSFATSSFDENKKLHYDWNSREWSLPLDSTADWLGSRAESPFVLDDTFSRRYSPLLPVDSEFRNSFPREREHWFPSSIAGSTNIGHVEDFFISSKEKESAIPDSDFFDIRGYRRSPHSYAVNEHHYNFDSRHSEPALRSYETDKYYYSKSFSEEIPCFHQDSSFEPFRHSSLPSVSPAPRNHHIDLAAYPPSYLIESDRSLSRSSRFPSPEHWSFPPMRLY